MLDMAEHAGDSYIQLKDVAERQNISRKYLENIMPELARCGLVESALGKAGGYKLTRQPADYKGGRNTLRAARANSRRSHVWPRTAKSFEHVDACYTLSFWRGLEEHINAYVNSYTLQDLLDSKAEEDNKCCGCTVCAGKEEN